MVLHMIFQHWSVTIIKSLKIVPTASLEIVVQSTGWQLLDGWTMAECTPGVLSRQTLQLQPSITKTPILIREDDQQKQNLVWPEESMPTKDEAPQPAQPQSQFYAEQSTIIAIGISDLFTIH